MRRASRGLALVEVLVALALGLMVVVAGATAYLGASETSRMADTQARLYDDAQAALAWLTQQIRVAGGRSAQAALTGAVEVSPALRGCDSSFADIRGTIGFDALACAATGADTPHAVAVRYEADRFNTAPTSTSSPDPTDCLGNALSPSLPATPEADTDTDTDTDGGPAPAARHFIADNRFFIATASGTGVPSLYCKGAGGPAQPLVENIEDLRLLYGVAASGSQQAVAGYLTASELNARAAAGAAPDPWLLVRSVQICVVVRSEQAMPDAAWSQYRRCDGTLQARAPDRRLRRAFSTTVALRNAPAAGLAPLSGAPSP